MKARFHIVRGFAFAAVSGLLIFFQNCSPQGFKSSVSSLSSTSSSSSLVVAPVAGGDTANTTPAPVVLNGKLIQVFIAHGHLGRSVMSCDDGLTWIHDVSDEGGEQCVPGLPDCDHRGNSAAGIDGSGGWVFSSYGHGAPGTLRRSRNGYTWETINTRSGSNSAEGVSFGNGTLVWNNGDFGLSVDFGKTIINNFTALPSALKSYFNFMRVERNGNTVLVSGNSGDPNVGPQAIVSQDSGMTWSVSALNGITLGDGYSFTAGKGKLVGVSMIHSRTTFDSTAYAFTSLDNGLTWNGSVVYYGTDYVDWSGLYFDGSQFVAWFRDQMWKSDDGVTWSATSFTGASANKGITTGSISRNPVTGTYVAIPNSWGGAYGKQKAYRSVDGLNWTQLDSAHFTGGHPLLKIISTTVDSSACQ